jgi:hypothetical protein
MTAVSVNIKKTEEWEDVTTWIQTQTAVTKKREMSSMHEPTNKGREKRRRGDELLYRTQKQATL